MALPVQHLLRLPSSLRCQILSSAPFLSRPLETRQNATRLLLRRTYARAKPPPKPSVRKPSPAAPDTPPPATTHHRPSPSGNPYADRLSHTHSPVLLYNSPAHLSFTIASAILGSIFFFSAFNTASLTKDPPPDADPAKARKHPNMPWYIKGCFLVGALVMASFGSTMMLAPTKIIRRVWLVRNEHAASPSGRSGRYSFHIETKPSIPFVKGRTIDTAAENVSIDRHIRAQDLSWISIPLSSSKEFSQHYLNNPKPPSLGILGRLSAINSALLRTWPSLKRNTRKILLRDGIAYVQIVGESGQWKLDLQGAEVLEGGQPLTKLFREDPRMSKGLVPFFQGLLGEQRSM